jgi:ABC-type branched-subunit amino acid transport system substrate-binding protein
MTQPPNDEQRINLTDSKPPVGGIPVPRSIGEWRRRKRLRALLAGLTAIASALMLAWWGWDDVVCGGPPARMDRIDGQCVGVTDGSYVFDEAFREILERIEAENQAVSEEKDQPQATITLLTILTPAEDSPLSRGRVLSALEGAHLAQVRANGGHDFGDPSPLIRLELANAGSHMQHWEAAVGHLARPGSDDAPLAAVIGMGVSNRHARDAAEELSRQDIPMVSGVLTADTLAHPEIEGLFRVAPSDTSYVAALREHIEGSADLNDALIVYDRNDDPYVQSIRAAYEDQLDDYLAYGPLPFVGGTHGTHANSAIFNPATTNICSMEPDLLLFAGRTFDLEPFADSLEARVCQEMPVTVALGVTGLSLSQDEERVATLEEHDITILFASGADPGWAEHPEEAPVHHYRFWDAYQREFPGSAPDDIRDGYALHHHDALATAASGLRIAADGAEVPAPEAVRTGIMHLHTANAVPAAGGMLSFSDADGSAGGKHVPVRALPEGEEPASADYVTAEQQ